MTSDVTLPANAYLHFYHDWNFEYSFDGGVVEYSLNGGNTWNDAQTLFSNNGYNGTISTSWGNPLGGRAAFVQESHGYTGSRLDLNGLTGQNARFRFWIGTDSTFGDWGWFIDDVRIYTCAAGNTSPRFLSSGLPTQGIPMNGAKDNAINLWQYVDDYEDADSNLTFSICNTPALSGTVAVDSNHYIDLNLTSDWEGWADVCLQATDTGILSTQNTFVVTTRLVYLPIVLKN